MSRPATLTAAAALLTVATVAAAGTAVAKPLERDTFHEEFSIPLTDFCGVTGLDITFDNVVDGEFTIGSKGRAQLPYYSAKVEGTRTFTNPDNDHFVTESFQVIEKDLKVTDNGDGTFTILVLSTGNSTLSGMDGNAIARDPGQLAARRSSWTTAARRRILPTTSSSSSWET